MLPKAHPLPRAALTCLFGPRINSDIHGGVKMKLSIFGLGYVGCVSAACFAKEGHEVVGCDVNALKVEIINSGKSPIVESGIGELIGEMVSAGRLRATTDSAEAVAT